jgi:PAS domain S-box-containing protein
MKPDNHAITILVIEDNPITRKMFRVALDSEGYTVLEATDGHTALDLMALGAPNLILQDLLLPDLDGFELVRRLRALPGGADIPILAISGLLSGADQLGKLPAGFTDYLFKPVEPSRLLHTVQAYLQPARASADKPGLGRRLLVADDDLTQLKLLKIEMERLGFQVDTAADGAEALAKAREAIPDAIVSDVLMPCLDGFRLCLAVRQDPRLADVPVVLTSAVYTEDADHQLAQNVGANSFLQRTGKHADVIAAVLRCLQEQSAPRPAGPFALPLEEYTHRVIRQLEHQVSLSASLTRRLGLLEVELGILARVVETLKKSTVIETVVEEMLYRCLDAAGISQGAAYLLEPDGQLTLRAQLGYPDDFTQPLMEFFGHAGMLHRTMEQREPIKVDAEAAAQDGAPNLCAQAGARSMLLAPLLLGEECLGVLQMASASRDLGDSWVAFAKTVGSQISQAIELARTLSLLSISERRYRDLVEGIDAVVWEGDVQRQGFTFVSRRAEALLGYPVDRWLAEPGFWSALLHPEEREATLALGRAAIAEGRDHALEYRLRTADRRTVWVHDSVCVVREGPAPACRLRGVMMDITGRKRAEQQEAQLRCAREIQQQLFPTTPPRPTGFDLGGASYPAEATGGDYFDYLTLADSSPAVVIGDVAGHGFGPALLMAQTRAHVRALALTQADVGAIAALLNRVLAADLVMADSFVTLLLARLDPHGRSLTYTSGGHPAGYVLDAAGAVRAVLPSLNPPLGVEAGLSFRTQTVPGLAPGDLILLLTDGVVEARSPDGTAFGIEPALDIARAHRNEPAGRIVERLYHGVRAFSHDRPQADDITAVVIKVEAAP